MNRLKMNNLKQEEHFPLFSKVSGLPQSPTRPPIKQLLVTFYSKMGRVKKITFI
jgi:hypothetical protein